MTFYNNEPPPSRKWLNLDFICPNKGDKMHVWCLKIYQMRILCERKTTAWQCNTVNTIYSLNITIVSVNI